MKCNHKTCVKAGAVHWLAQCPHKGAKATPAATPAVTPPAEDP